jgi:N6-adenosine-specific RNA methylase IME4
LINNLEEQGIPKKRTIVRFSEWSARPLFEKKNIDFKEKAIESIAESLRNDTKKWTVGNVKRLIVKLKNNGSFTKASSLPLGVFNVLYADPAWPYDNTGVHGSAEKHYDTMSIEDICSMKLPVADNAVLFLWVTNPMLEVAFQVVHAWGFEYKTNIVWVKTNLEKPGVGFYVRGRHELLFICTKGSFLPDQVGKEPLGSVVTADIQEHSRKPELFYDIIERMYPKQRYLELFARRTRSGWSSWGDQLVVAQ